MAAVTICSDLGAQKVKSDVVSTVSPSIGHEVMGPDAMIFVLYTQRDEDFEMNTKPDKTDK